MHHRYTGVLYSVGTAGTHVLLLINNIIITYCLRPAAKPVCDLMEIINTRRAVRYLGPYHNNYNNIFYAYKPESILCRTIHLTKYIRALLRMARIVAVMIILLLKYNLQGCRSRYELKSLKFVGFSNEFILYLQTCYLYSDGPGNNITYLTYTRHVVFMICGL